MRSEIGKADTKAVIIVAAVIYFTFLSRFALALGFVPTSLAGLSQTISEIDLGPLSFLFDIAGWAVTSVGVYFCMIGFTVTGAIPIWVGSFFIVPVGLGVGWAVMELVRG